MPFRQYPNKLRLVYYPAGTKAGKKNVAYKYVNKDQMDEELFKKKYKLDHQFFVVPEKDNLCNVNVLRGASIEPYEKMAESLIVYLEKAKGVKVYEIVLDFIIDENKLPWLSEVKSVKSKNLTKIWDVGTQ